MNQPDSDIARNDIMLRLFIGITCPPVDKIADLLKELQIAALQPESGIRVVPEANLHITIKFLGPVPSSAIADITAVLDEVAVDTRPFLMTLIGAGLFKDAFWLGVQPCDALANLASVIEKRLELFGFQPESRPYIPHLTVARLEQNSRRTFTSRLKQYEGVIWGVQEVQAVHLFKSETLPSGLQNSILHTSRFTTLA